MKYDTLLRLAKQSTVSVDSFLALLSSLSLTGHWAKFAGHIRAFLTGSVASNGKEVPFTVFAKGNSKLPFYSFSVVPLFTCPGKGACAKFCYSLKAWRYPAAFFRQVQNTFLVRSRDERLTTAWMRLKNGAEIRLYVDGDFDSIETLRYWMDLCHLRPDLNVYGYSKSWDLFLQLDQSGYDWPSNYTLNLSSGSIYEIAGVKLRSYRDRTPIGEVMAQLAVTRGSFIAVPVKAPNRAKNPATFQAYAKDVRASAEKLGYGKVFVCPGRCGDCTPTGHACGSERFKGVPIAIGIH